MSDDKVQDIEELQDKLQRIKDALDSFALATTLYSQVSLAIQQHDPSWEAWKKLCDVTYDRTTKNQ
jgi:hypothetical protein